ncbi:unnamed protein product [Acanthocheilonema viteae]|uniref:Uncharacterized protein n=1 Tax=Acanthocheilonema viteae TaxID=6277 RepID=A0A498SEE9_ACAVI|nr:unnamed protein product [Acanthocheilonema viteae]
MRQHFIITTKLALIVDQMLSPCFQGLVYLNWMSVVFLVKVNRSIQIHDGVKRNETITYDFVDQNYASVIAEDWVGTFNWPNCKGYGDPPTDHYGGLQYFADFFRKHVKNLDYSFVFLMGDHGLRFGSIRETVVGEAEDNNPLLTIALPKYLRSNKQLILNLKQNSRRHTSHFDFYATLYDIARYARKDNFQKWDEHDFRSEFGETRGGIRAKSMLRPILYDRTCEEMEIPDEYCICERTWYKSDINSYDVKKSAQFLVISAQYIEERPLLKVVVKASPSNGKYEAQLLKEKNSLKIITKVIIRLDQYGEQGHCAPAEDVRPLCYCRQQLTTTPATMH